MWALDYRKPGDYSFEQGDFYDLLERFPEKCLFSSKEEAEEYGQIYSDVDRDLTTVYAVKYDEENEKADIVSGTKSELLALGFVAEDILLWEGEAQMHQANFYHRLHTKDEIVWLVFYNDYNDFTIESCRREDVDKKHNANDGYAHVREFLSQKAAEDYIKIRSDAVNGLIPVYKIKHDRERGTAEIVSGTIDELRAQGFNMKSYLLSKEDAEASKKTYELNMRLRIKKKMKKNETDC